MRLEHFIKIDGSQVCIGCRILISPIHSNLKPNSAVGDVIKSGNTPNFHILCPNFVVVSNSVFEPLGPKILASEVIGFRTDVIH